MAGLFRRLATAFRKDAVVGSELVHAFNEWGLSTAGIAVNDVTALRYVAVMTCVAILAEDIAKLPVRMMRRLPNGGKEQVANHFLARLLRHPNAWQTRFEFMEMMMASVVLRGNAWAVILRDANGFPTQLVPLHPDRVTLFEAPGGEWFWVVTRQGLHEMAVLRDMPVMIHSDDMLHIRWLQTWHSLLGTHRVALMRETIGLGMAQEQYATRLMGSGARPGGVLQTDRKLSEEAFERLRDGFNQNYAGLRNAGRTAILEEGLKWQPLAMTAEQAEALKSREFQLEDVGRGFGVPRHRLGLPIERGDLVQLQQLYLNTTLTAWAERWVPKFEDLGELDGQKLFVEFDYSHFLKADLQTRLTAMRTGVVGMVYTPNEARLGEDLGAVEGGDTLYQPVNVAPIGYVPQSAANGNNAPNGPGSDQSGEAAPGGRGDGSRPADLPDEAPNV
ncbi:MAG TPA: phage portal protein [Stellaceae bacterium]|nr:phage portal protein [Stellaceae bacterium]